MTPTLVIDYSEIANTLLEELNLLILGKDLPSIGIDKGICDDIVLAAIGDAILLPLDMALNRPIRNGLPELIEGVIKADIAIKEIKNNSLEKLHPEIQYFFSNDQQVRQVFNTYMKEGLSATRALLYTLPRYKLESDVVVTPQVIYNHPRIMIEEILSIIERVYPCYCNSIIDPENIEDNDYRAKVEYDNSMNEYVNNIINTITDSGSLFRLIELLHENLSDNPYNVWNVKINNTLCILELKGDYRILEWHKLNS